jgi:hypothetical protein
LFFLVLFEKQIGSWDREDCPLCKNGSAPITPKGNWAELTA